MRQAAQAHAYTPPDPVLLDGFSHVLRTRRMKTASRRQQRRDRQLVDSQQADRHPIYLPLHFWITLLMPCSRSAKGASRAARRGLRTMSHTGSSSPRCSRNASRKRRLILFRTTLPPIALGTVRPNRGPDLSPSGRAKQKAANNGPETRVPWSYTLRNSAERSAGSAGSTGLGVADGLLVAHGQLVAAASPPARQHGPAVFRFHALAKSVRLGALAIVGLKCPFRHIGSYSARTTHRA